MDRESEALLELGRALRATGYTFVTVSPATHSRVQRNAQLGGRERARDLRDVFGWNLPFAPELLPPPLLELLQAAGGCRAESDGLLRASVRASSLGDQLFLHSGFPTCEEDAVFFGPDTYRFCAFLRRALPPCRRLVDVGCGTGVGGITAAGAGAREIVLSDVTSLALRFARVNAALAGVDAEIVESNVLDSIDGEIDVVIANPPYLDDGAARVYRDGGGEHGEGLSVRIVAESLERLAPGGWLLLYTGVAIVDGHDAFAAAIEPHLRGVKQWSYDELDPDVFGEELDRDAYRDVDRIAVVALRVCKS